VSAPRPPSRLRGLLGFALAGALSGCATLLPTPAAPIPDAARRALDVLTDRWREFSDLRALADITLRRGSERHRLTGVLLARAPGSLRFEALSPFGQPYLLVAVHGGALTAFDAATNEAFVGRATAETAARLFHLPLEPDDLVAVLAGRASPPRDLRTAALLPPDEEGPSLELVSAVNRQRVWMDLETGVVRHLQIAGGRLEARISYLRDGQGELAGFDLAAAGSFVTGSVRYQRLVLGAGIDPERFILAIPKGAKTQAIR
jgi:outer membrane lipoprotein-sorting protein